MSSLVLHYCGPLPAKPGGWDADLTPIIAAIDAVVTRADVSAHGSLAAGADIIVTERVLAAGGAVHVVLPFPADDFIATSVAPSGPAWVARFDEVLAAAASVTVVTDERGDDDDAAFARCSEVAMEMASAAARRNGAPAEQLALWNGVPSTRKGSTAADVARWKALGFPSTVVSLEPR